jgi:cytosine/adenosine deaminase-related metal-dependent hydrolase/SAM-dependent methyltransferase
MLSTSATTRLSPAEGYRLWARTYDHEPNPMLSLESRVLEPLLPTITGLDVVDLGCGTGRWLEVLQKCDARSLLGVDFSREMLDLAASKLGAAARLVHGNCGEVPLADNSADLVLCNFVLSYIEDAEALLKRVRWALRPGGTLCITDIHPGTASALNWRRGGGPKGDFREIFTSQRPIEEVLSICKYAGLHVRVRLEPRFGEPEQRIFEGNGRGEYFDRIRDFPAIYVLQLSAPQQGHLASVHSTESRTICSLSGARFALGPQDNFRGEMRLADSRIESMREESRASSDRCHSSASIDLQGFLMLPGLVNAHDHLEFALFPRLGRGAYKNFLEWVEDIYHPGAPPITEHRAVPRTTRLWWGGIRNLLCGVTTVCHHNPYDSELFEKDFAVRVLKDYGWAHSFALDAQISEKKKATPAGQPFLIHLAEGIDARSAQEIFQLDRAGALDHSTVVIHGLGLDGQGRELLRSNGAGLIWCPSSNVFLFGRTLTQRQLREVNCVALGSDSPLTAQGDLLDEVRYAFELQPARAEDLYRYVTGSPAMMLGLKNGEASFRADGVADLIAVRDTGATPAETLVNLSYRDVELVVIGGRVQLASDQIKSRLAGSATEGLQPLEVENIRRWVRAPLDQMFADTTPHLGNEIHLGGKQVRLGTAT